MRCLHCFRTANTPLCPPCAQNSDAAREDAPPLDVAASILDAIEREATPVDDDLWDRFCVALAITASHPAPPAREATRIAGEITPARHGLLGLYAAHQIGDETAAAAHFLAAHADKAATLPLGPARIELRPSESDTVSLWLQLNGVEELVGRIDPASKTWVDGCRVRDCALLEPHGWSAWRTQLACWKAAGEALQSAVTDAGTPYTSDTTFRALWKDFQHALGEQRDQLERPGELEGLLATLGARDRAALRGLEGARCVSAIVDASRDALRVRADALRQQRVQEIALQARDAFGRGFIDGGLPGLDAMRDALRVETSGAHAELRKALDYQGRLLRGAQEALNGSLAELGRRAAGLLGALTPQRLFDDAAEQAELVLERAREVAMIEQTDAYLQCLSGWLEEAATERMTEVAVRRALLDAMHRSVTSAAHALGIEGSLSARDTDAVLREEWLRSAPTPEGLAACLDGLLTEPRQAALSTR